MSILNVKDLKKSYLNPDTKEKFNAVDGISFEIETTQIYGILGPNGAGKTTTFYMLVGLIRCNNGMIMIDDEEITSLPMHMRSDLGISYLPQAVSYTHLTLPTILLV